MLGPVNELTSGAEAGNGIVERLTGRGASGRDGFSSHVAAPAIAAHVVQLVDEIGHFRQAREAARELRRRGARGHQQRQLARRRRFVHDRAHERGRVVRGAQNLGAGEEALDARADALAIAVRGEPAQRCQLRVELGVDGAAVAQRTHNCGAKA